MTDTTKTKTETQNDGRKPDFKLVQEKAYNHTGPNGQLVRKSKTVDITVGWQETSKKDGMEYISLADSVMDITADVDGRVKLVLFPIKDKDQN